MVLVLLHLQLLLHAGQNRLLRLLHVLLLHLLLLLILLELLLLLLQVVLLLLLVLLLMQRRQTRHTVPAWGHRRSDRLPDTLLLPLLRRLESVCSGSGSHIQFSLLVDSFIPTHRLSSLCRHRRLLLLLFSRDPHLG